MPKGIHPVRIRAQASNCLHVKWVGPGSFCISSLPCNQREIGIMNHTREATRAKKMGLHENRCLAQSIVNSRICADPSGGFTTAANCHCSYKSNDSRSQSDVTTRFPRNVPCR